MTYIWIIIGLIVIYFLWTIIECRILVVSRFTIPSKALGKDVWDLSFVVLADIHNRSFGKNNKRLIKKILEETPDFVIIAGDMINKRKPCYPSKAFNLIKEISEHYPVYYAYGNHEQYFVDLEHANNEDDDKNNKALYEAWSMYKVELIKLGVCILDNNSIILQHKEDKLTITGLSISTDFYDRRYGQGLGQDEIYSRIGSRSREGYQILIAHNPLFFLDYQRWGADLVISGHMHGGLIRLPFVRGIISPQVKFFPKYDAGLYTENDSHMVISRGLGSHSFMPRFLNPPELVVINLNNR